MSRIKSCNVNFGESLTVGEINDVEAKKQEEIAKIEGMALPVLKKAQAQAEAIIAEAQAKAEKILQDVQGQKIELQIEIEEQKKKILDDAAKDGFEKGRLEIFVQMQEKLAAADSFAKHEFEMKNKILESSKKDMVALCLKICEKICTLSLNESVLEEIISKALALLETKEQVNIMIHPNLTAKLGDDFDAKFNNIKVVQNSRIADDAIIVESLGGNIDCSISSQIEKIASELLNVE